MSNNNLKNCIEAIQQLGLEGKITYTIGKNPEQATRLQYNGVDVSVSSLYKVSDFIDFIENNLQVNSVAKSKFNECNAENEKKELQMWNKRNSTYAKKNRYNYTDNNLNTILTWTTEDFGVTYPELKRLHDNWNADPDGWKVSIEKCKDLYFKNGMYVAKASLQQTCKEWLSAHDLFEKYQNSIDLIIDKWVKIGGQ